MQRKSTLFHEMKILLAVTLTLMSLELLVLIYVSCSRASIPAVIYAFSAVTGIALAFYWRKIMPQYKYYIKICKYFRDGEIYNEYIDNIGGLFPMLKEDVQRIDKLIDRQNIMQLSTKQAEFLALQNQINPHFLYNTLDSIRGDALAAGVESIANITEALSTFFRYTITETRNLVTIGDELENVKDYFTIQRYRFGDKLSMSIDIADDKNTILAMQCPKLFLQPIIENSIFHGLERKTKDGILTIQIELVDKILHVNVSDNGVGIPEDKLFELNQSLARVSVGAIVEPSGRHQGGIALKNVCRRIKLLFGEEYGVHISSIPGMGTKVEVILPAIAKNSDSIEKYKVQ